LLDSVQWWWCWETPRQLAGATHADAEVTAKCM